MFSLEDKKQLIEIIKKHAPKAKIYLFGSRARNTHSLASDIDLAIECDGKIDKFILSNIKEGMEESMVPFFVDVVDLNDIDQDLKKQILKDRVLWID